MLLCDRQDENKIKSLIHAWTYGGSPGANKSKQEDLSALRRQISHDFMHLKQD